MTAPTTHDDTYVAQLADELTAATGPEQIGALPVLLIAPWFLLAIIQRLEDLTFERDAARQTVEAEQDACTCRRQRPQPIPPKEATT